MNKVIRQLIKEMIEGISIKENDESNIDPDKPSYLAIRNVAQSGGNLDDPSNVVSQLSKDSSTGTQDKPDKKEVELFMSQEYDRFSSIFPQIRSTPRYFSIGNSITINKNEIVLNAGNDKKVEVQFQKKENNFPGTVNLKTYGSFHKNTSIKHSDDLIQVGYRSVMDPSNSTQSVAGEILQSDPRPAPKLTQPTRPAKPTAQLSNQDTTDLNSYLDVFNQTVSNFKNKSVVGSQSGLSTTQGSTLTLKELSLIWKDWAAGNISSFFKQSPTGPQINSFEKVYNSLEDITLPGNIKVSIVKNKRNIASESSVMKNLRGAFNKLDESNNRKKNLKNELSSFLKLLNYYYDGTFFRRAFRGKQHPFNLSTDSDCITNQINDWVKSKIASSSVLNSNQQAAFDQAMQTFTSDQAAYKKEQETLQNYYSSKYSPENVIQSQAAAAGSTPASKDKKLTDAMLQFAHAAKGKVVVDLDVDDAFAKDIIEVNVKQFSELLNEFNPEVVIIPGSSSQFNTDYFNRIKQEVQTLGINIKDYSSFKSTHIVDYDVDDAIIDQISQATRDSGKGTSYRTEFWDKDPDDAKKYYISNIHMGLSQDKYYPNLSNIRMHYLIKETIKEYGNLIKDNPEGITMTYPKVIAQLQNSKSPIIGESPIVNISATDADIIDVLKYTDPNITLFVAANFPNIDDKLPNPKNSKAKKFKHPLVDSSQLEQARINVAKKMQNEIDFFKANGRTRTMNNLQLNIVQQNTGEKNKRLKRMTASPVGTRYTIDKQEKQSKTVSEMGALKISELGALGTINQSKRIFMRDMHLLIDLKQIDTSFRNDIIDILNGFASAAYNAFQGIIIDFASRHIQPVIQKANELASTDLNNYSAEIGDIMLLLKDNIGELAYNPMAIMNPSLPVIMQGFIKKYEEEQANNNLDPESKKLLDEIYNFIVTDFEERAQDIQNYIEDTDSSFEEFVSFYKEEIFKIISVKGEDLSDVKDIMQEIGDLTKQTLGLININYEFKIEDITRQPGPYDNVIAEINKIISVGGEHPDIEDIKMYLEMIKDENESDEDKDEVIGFIKEILSVPGEENDKLARDISSLNTEIDLQKKAKLNEGLDEESKALQDQLQKELGETRFFEKSIASVLYGFARKICLEGPGQFDQSFDLAGKLNSDSSFLIDINAQLARECLTQIKMLDTSFVIYPLLNTRDNTIIFSVQEESGKDLSFSIDFDLASFVHSRIDQTNKLIKEVYSDFSFYGFKRPRRILMIDDNVSSGGTYAMIAKSILELQQKEGCYFTFEPKSATIKTQFMGDPNDFSLDNVKPANNVCLTHIIGLTPIFI